MSLTPCCLSPGLLRTGLYLCLCALFLSACGTTAPVQTHKILTMSVDEGTVGAQLKGITALSYEALSASQAAAQAPDMATLKQNTDRVFATIWGAPSGLVDETGAAQAHGWKTRWQVTYTDFDPNYAKRYGNAPPEITDPSQLGIAGRGRYLRARLQGLIDDEGTDAATRSSATQTITALNNVIGWQKMDDGVTKAERQPRVDLTREWDAPQAFWNSDADTGWLHKVHAQAVNILKTDYQGDLAMARTHARDMTALIQAYLDGKDANKDGTVAPDMMEGGLFAALAAAETGMLLDK